METQYFERFN